MPLEERVGLKKSLMLHKSPLVVQAFSRLILILYQSQLDACCAGFLASHPDIV